MPVFQSRAPRVAALVLVGLKLWLVAAQPVCAIGDSSLDDRLFVRLAGTILGGQWLGPYTEATLAKGPAFPVFIATTVLTGIPLPLAQHLLYLFACWLVVRATRDLLPHDGWALGLFAVLWWQPMSFDVSVLGRVLRQNIYTPTGLLVFAGLAALHTRATAPRWIRSGWAILLGLAFAALWLTREESAWIVPSGVILVSAAVGFERRKSRWRWQGLGPVGVAAFAATVPILTVAGLNRANYGWFGTVEFRAPEFIAAYGALNRVQIGAPVDYVPLTHASRLALYEVSPSFRELRPFLEGQAAIAWSEFSAGATRRDPAQREIAGGWWMWALRAATASAGHAHSAAEALAFYQRLADEVNAACDEKKIPAGPPRATLFPPWHPEYTARFFRDLPGYCGYFLTGEGFSARTPNSSGNAATLRLFRDLTQWPLSHSDEAPELDVHVSAGARRVRMAVLQLIGTVLRPAATGLILAGGIAWVWSLGAAVRGRTIPGYRWWFATAALMATGAVVLINFLIHVSSFLNLSPGAFAQAYPLILLFAVMAVADASMRRAAGRRLDTQDHR